MQDAVNKAQERLEKAIRAFQALEKQSCTAAASCEKSAAANARFTEALGLLIQAKGRATTGCNAMPGVQPQFGGGK